MLSNLRTSATWAAFEISLKNSLDEKVKAIGLTKVQSDSECFALDPCT